MESGAIDIDEMAGGLDLQATLESGQTYLWWRPDGDTYGDDAPTGGSDWYETTHTPDPTAAPQPLRVRQADGRLEWEATFDAESVVRRRLRLSDDLPALRDATPDYPELDRAWAAYWGMRLVDEPVFPTLVTFICSAQMRVERIFAMQQALRRALGPTVSVDGRMYHGYPTPETLAQAGETRLRELGLGYRAPYVVETAAMVADGSVDPYQAEALPYERAREHLTQFVGVGEKVADCVCLFALDHMAAVPLDTWIRKAIRAYYPECTGDSYRETSRAIRARFGGDHTAGYTQTYLFHWLRHREKDLPAV